VKLAGMEQLITGHASMHLHFNIFPALPAYGRSFYLHLILLLFANIVLSFIEFVLINYVTCRFTRSALTLRYYADSSVSPL